MRYVHVRIPRGQRDRVLDALAAENVDYVVTEVDDADGEGLLVQFPLPTEAVDTVIERLRGEGVDESFVVIGNAETATTPHFGDLEERFVEGTEETDAVLDAEIRSKARNLNPGRRTYYAMTLLSVLVATVGLLLDAPAVVVGSMVIAPQVGSALTASVGVAFSDRRMIRNGMRAQVLGLGAAVICAVAFGWVLRTAAFVPATVDVSTISQISARTSPGMLSVIVGVCAGAAGAFGLSTDLPVSLVGVAVAAALIPAAAAVGIGLAWGYPVVAVGALVLLVVNLLSITVSGAVALWYLGYRPDPWEDESPVRSVASGAVNATVLALVAFVVVGSLVGATVVEQSAFENATNDAIGDVLDRPAYDRLELLSVRVEFGDYGVGGSPREVTVAVRRPAGTSHPLLATRIRSRIGAATGTDVAVTVTFVEFDRTG